jgi:hypothetical protein
VNWKWKWFSVRKSWIKLIIDEKSPDVSERDATYEIIDIYSAVTQSATFFIWLSNL